MTARMDLADRAVDDPNAGSLQLALAAEVALVPLVIVVPAVMRVILDFSCQVVRTVWVPQQFVDASGLPATPRRVFLGTNPLPG